MQTLKEQNIDTKKIDYISFERPTDCMVILFKDGSSLSHNINLFILFAFRFVYVITISTFVNIFKHKKHYF